MKEIQDRWPDYLGELTEEKEKHAYYCYGPDIPSTGDAEEKVGLKETLLTTSPIEYSISPTIFFLTNPPCSHRSIRHWPRFWKKHRKTWLLKRCLEDPLKVVFLSCQSCGDCAIQHVGFPLPESKCPKHTRNGPCGGSRDGYCEVYPEQRCIWVRAYARLKQAKGLSGFLQDKVPPPNVGTEQNLLMGEFSPGQGSSPIEQTRQHQRRGGNR